MVEDDPEALDSTAQLLRGHGHEVVEARDGPTAMSCTLSKELQLVILDLRLPSPNPDKCPVFDGYTVLAWLKRMSANKRIPIIVVSGIPASVGKPEALSLGACAYLEKPVDAHKLLTAIRVATEEI